MVIQDTRRDLVIYLERLDECKLSGLQKCWGYQYVVLPKLKWPLAIYDIPFSTVALWEQTTNKYLRKWLGVGHTLSRACLFSSDSSVSLPLDSLLDTWKVEKCRLQQSYDTSKDSLIQAVRPAVASGRVWSASDTIIAATRDLECEAIRGVLPPHFRAGIGHGDWKKPWQKMSDKERQRGVMARVKENLAQEREATLGMLELQSRWAVWREEVLKYDLSWHALFNMGDSLVGFMLSAVYGTLITPSLASKWDENEDGKCKLCEDALGSLKHILSGCIVALHQGRYTWRHNKVLRQISQQVIFHCENRVNNPRRPLAQKSPVGNINFVAAGTRPQVAEGAKPKNVGFGILSEARDWRVICDLGGQLSFPSEIAKTRLRPDLIIYSSSLRRVVWWELTCPSEERISEAHELKLDRYSALKAECEDNGWSCFSQAIEVGARGMVAESLSKAARLIGLRGRALKKLVTDAGKEAAHCSRWIYLLSGKKEWEYQEVRVE